MPSATPAEYKARKVRDWLTMADNGEIALPSFQRSYVWDNARIANYLKALFENRPTGIFLTLPVQRKLSFESRTLNGVDANPTNAKELVLDGQQRLTSLWNTLKGKQPYKFYVQVENVKHLKMAVKKVEFYSTNSVKGRAIGEPKIAYEKNLVPIDILEEATKDPRIRGKIWNWCKAACDNGVDAEKIYDMVMAITFDLGLKLLAERELHYCLLPPDTKADVAIKIFVETNRSSATVRMFDIVVAVAQGKYYDDLRKRIRRFQNATPVIAHYFDRDEQKMIPQVGEWLLKVACLKVRKVKGQEYKDGLPPKEGNYRKALHGLFEGGKNCGLKRFEKLQKNLKAALDIAGQHGGATRRTLPGWPPVHVIAALQDDLRAIGRPAWRGTANQLIAAYLWRSFLTDRYQSQANDRLHVDFQGLRKCLKGIKISGSYTPHELPPIFDNKDHPIPTTSDLDIKNPLQWIGRGRLGPAIAAVAMQKTPKDWVLGDKLDANTIRDLEDRRKLDRHHIFSNDFLGDHFGKKEIDHGLNGVLLSKEGNLSLGKKAPDVYLKKILNQPQGPSEEVLRDRVESHLVPYDALMSQGTQKSRYKSFIKQRAKLIADEIKRLVRP